MSKQTAPTTQVAFAVEESKHPRNGYKMVHAAGCRHLRDPEPFQCEPTLTALIDQTELLAVDALDEADMYRCMSPCAQKLIPGGAPK